MVMHWFERDGVLEDRDLGDRRDGDKGRDTSTEQAPAGLRQGENCFPSIPIPVGALSKMAP